MFGSDSFGEVFEADIEEREGIEVSQRQVVPVAVNKHILKQGVRREGGGRGEREGGERSREEEGETMGRRERDAWRRWQGIEMEGGMNMEERNEHVKEFCLSTSPPLPSLLSSSPLPSPLT